MVYSNLRNFKSDLMVCYVMLCFTPPAIRQCKSPILNIGAQYNSDLRHMFPIVDTGTQCNSALCHNFVLRDSYFALMIDSVFVFFTIITPSLFTAYQWDVHRTILFSILVIFPLAPFFPMLFLSLGTNLYLPQLLS